MVPSMEVVVMLADHYVFAFEAIPWITLRSGGEVEGNLFQYCGDRLGLKDVVEDFD